MAELSALTWRRPVLGVPFNIAPAMRCSYMMAAQAGLSVGEDMRASGDCHIYDNHVEQVRLQLS